MSNVHVLSDVASLPMKKRYREYIDNHNGESHGHSSVYNNRESVGSCLDIEKKDDPPNPTKVDSSSSSACTSGERGNVEQEKRRSGSKKPNIAPNPSMERKVPEWVLQEMGNINSDFENPKVVFETSLSVSDVSPSQSRLLIPFKALINTEFLTQDEETAMNSNNGGVGTILVNERSQKWSLRFKKWSMKKKKSGKQTFYYVLNSGWNNVVKENNLKVIDKIRLWSFRNQTGVLSFALELLV